jgi:hypothetical protein
LLIPSTALLTSLHNSWAKEAQERAEMLRQDIEMIKRLGIAIVYENQKEKLKKHEEEIFEDLNYASQLMRESQHQADAAKDVTQFEALLRNCDTLLEEIYLKTLKTYHVQDAAGTVPSDWDAATQRAKHAHDQLQTFGGLIGGIQEAITDALAKAKTEIEQAKNT